MPPSGLRRRISARPLRYTQIGITLRITMIHRLPEDAQTLHAELLALLLALEGQRGWSHLSGAFTYKRVKGAEYAYFQYSDPGGAKRQLSVGRRTAALDDIVHQYREEREEYKAEQEQVVVCHALWASRR